MAILAPVLRTPGPGPLPSGGVWADTWGPLGPEGGCRREGFERSRWDRAAAHCDACTFPWGTR